MSRILACRRTTAAMVMGVAPPCGTPYSLAAEFGSNRGPTRMLRILADNDIVGHVRARVQVCESSPWVEF